MEADFINDLLVNIVTPRLLLQPQNYKDLNSEYRNYKNVL